MIDILPSEIIRLLLTHIDDSTTYHNILQANTLFLDILSSNDLDNIKHMFTRFSYTITEKLKVMHNSVIPFAIKLYKIYYTLPDNSYSIKKYRYRLTPVDVNYKFVGIS